MMCGPTCGCGKDYEVEANGQEHHCPHCGLWWGRAPVSAEYVAIAAPAGPAEQEVERGE